MYSVKTASLVLKTSDITTSPDFIYNFTDYTGERGSINKSLSSITWNNINLRQILGDMYDEFDEFNLVLKQVTTSYSNNRYDGSASDSRSIYFKISGLPFINNSYQVITQHNNNTANIGTLFCPNNFSSTFIYRDASQLTFGKVSSVCDITIEMMKIVDDTLVSFGVAVNQNSQSTVFNYASCTWDIGVAKIKSNTAISNITGFRVIPPNNGFPSGTVVTGILSPDPDTLLNTFILSNKALTNQATATPVSFYCSMPNFIFIFDIYGIPKDKNNFNNSRI